MQRRRWGGGWKHTRQTLEKSPTSKLYTTWAHILSDRNVFAPRGGAGSNAPGAFLVFHYYPVVRRGSSNTRFFYFPFFWWSLAPVFARPNILVASFATQAVVASFATQARACILSDHNIFYTPRGGGNGGVMPLGLFLFSIFLVVTCPRPPVFARPNKYSWCLSLDRLGLVS